MASIQHVVTRPTAPFLAMSGAIEVAQVPLWQDNLGWIIACTKTGLCALVDGPEAGPYLDVIAQRGWTLAAILNTHTHGDHIGVNRDLQRRGMLGTRESSQEARKIDVLGPSRRPDDVPGITHPVGEGDAVRVGEAVGGEVWLTEGHIDGHVSFLFGDVLFCGDTMFGAGCGYLFDGPPAKMHASLQRIATLPDDTRVCCAHEYTEDNLRFAMTVEPSNEDLQQRTQTVARIRATGGSSVPSTVGEEKATNPFVRTGSAEIRAAVAAQMGVDPQADDAAIFAATRALKDTRRYKQ